MFELFLIGAGGFIGAILRFGVSNIVQYWLKNYSFPYSTLLVNLLGCLLIGSLSELIESRGVISPEYRLFLFVGLLGAFTTYSTFGNESLNLLMNGKNPLFLANIGLHIILGLCAVWLGRVITLYMLR